MLLFVVTSRHHDHHEVLGAEALVDLLLGNLGSVLGIGGKRGIAVNVVGLVGENEACHQDHREYGRNHEARLYVELSDSGDVRHEVAVMGLVDERREGHQQTGHEGEYDEDTEEDSLAEHHAEVKTEFELHKHHRDHTGKRGKAAGGYLRDSLAEGGNHRVPGVHGDALLGVSVAEDYRIVDGERQLKNYRNGVGNEGDLAEQEVRAHVEQRRHAERSQQDGYLHIGVGGEEQHGDYDDQNDHDNDLHFGGDGFGSTAADRTAYVFVIRLELLLYCNHRVLGDLVVLLAVEGDGEQRGAVLVAVLVVLNGDGGDSVDFLKLRGDLLRLFIGDVLKHYAAGAVGDELVVHQVKTHTGLRTVRQIAGDVVVHLRPARGYGTENPGDYVEQIERLALVNDKRSDFFYRRLLFLLRAHLHSPVLIIYNMIQIYM